MTKTKTDSNQVSIHQHQDYIVKWRQIQNSKQKWIVIKRPFLVEINGHGNICNSDGRYDTKVLISPIPSFLESSNETTPINDVIIDSPPIN